MPLLPVQKQVEALLLLQDAALGERPTWAGVIAAVAAAAEAQGHDANTAALMGQFAAHQMGIAKGSGKPHGGARLGAGRKPFPDMGLGGIVVQVVALDAIIARWQRVGPAFRLEPATNWRELQEAAEEEVRGIGGDIAVPGIYPCSPALARLAEWPE